MASEETFFKDQITAHIKSQLSADKEDGGSGVENTELLNFLTSLTKTFGIDYSTFSPFISGNYAVFMQHGTWFKVLHEYAVKDDRIPPAVTGYISLMDNKKTDIRINNYELYGKKFTNLLKFSQTITDISLPEPTKEYMAISTRQKNSFINTRDYVGSDFNMNFIDNKDLGIFKYMEAWNKSIDLIREGLFFSYSSDAAADYFENLIQEDYLIDNPYCNTVWIALLDSKGVDLRGIIALFGVMPMNTQLKNLIGDRGSPKAVTYNLNFKFMDMQYMFIDGWDKLQKVSNGANNETTLGKKFFDFLNYSNTSDDTSAYTQN
jgi:hypothetical protein